MSQPTPYTPSTDFSQQEAINASGRSTVNTSALDAELANIETTLDQALANMALLQRDDGRLKDTVVEVRCLDQAVLTLIGGYSLRGLWTAATAYAVNDICSNGAYTYVCRTSHTSSGAFNGSFWIQFGFTSGADAAAAAAAAQGSATTADASAVAAANSAASAATSKAGAISSASAANSSASTATTRAGDASASAVNAAASASQAAASAASAGGFSSGWQGSNNVFTGTNKFDQGVKSNRNYDVTAAVGALQINGVDAFRFGGDTSGQLAGFRNKLINCTGMVNQLALTSPVTLAAGAYGHDGFKAGAGGCTYSFVVTANRTIFTITAGTLVQVANGKYLQSGTHTLGWDGTAQARIDGGAYSASPLLGTAVGGTNQICEWGVGTLSLPQYEPGSIRTSTEIRDDEKQRCMEYYEAGGIKFSAAGSAVVSATISFKQAKNAVPVMTYGTSPQGAGTALPTGADSTSTSEVFVYANAASINCSWTASARL